MHRPAIWLPLLCIGLVYFVWRGPLRAFQTTGNFDFRVVQNAAQTFQEGKNPYSHEDLLAVAEAHGRRWQLERLLNVRLLYGPGFPVLFAPLGWIGTGTAAAAAWLTLELLAFVGLAASIIRLMGLDRPLWPIFGAVALCWAPVHTNIALGQPSIFFTLLTAAFFLFLQRKQDVLSGLSFGLLTMKLSLAAPAALLALFHRKWKPLALGCALALVISTPFVLRYGLTESVIHYHSAISAVSRPGADADDSRQNPLRSDLINLRSWLYSWEMPPLAVELLNGCYLGFLCAVLYRHRELARIRNSQGLYWTLAAVFICLSLYHRFYDAAILLIGAAAALALCKSYPRRAALMAVLLVPFLVPGSALLNLALSDFAARNPWAEALIVRHQVPALVALGLCCAWWLREDALAPLAPRRANAPARPYGQQGTS